MNDVKRPRSLWVWLGLLALLLPSAALADGLVNEAICQDPGKDLDPHRQLRALSLQLRGVVPTVDEHATVDLYGEVPDVLIDEWLGSEAFGDQVVRMHRGLLWNNVSNVNLFNARSGMTRSRTSSTDPYRYWRRQQAVRYRGDTTRACLDQPAEWDANGQIVTYDQGDGTIAEGWVEVTPYWAPDTTIRVCAFDAQDAFVSPNGTRCDTTDGYEDLACGCGPNLSWCRYGAATTRAPVEAMAEDVDRRIKANVLGDDSYLDLFTGRKAFVNGPLVHYLTYQTGIPAGTRFTPDPYPELPLPDLDWADADTWQEIELGPEHAGILTSPAFLLRFQTNRSRANRFYTSFMCQPFQPPDSGIPTGEADAVQSLDLQVQDGCKYCHALLEPAASHWSRWTESGAGYLDAESFPSFDEDCLRCATTGESCSQECRRHYITEAVTSEEVPWFGWMKSYEFRRDEHMEFPDAGPSRLALQATVDGRFPECVAETAAQWLLGRPLLPEEDEYIVGLASTFQSQDFSYRALVKAIVTSETWRRVQ